MKEVDFSEFRVRYSAIIEQVRKTRQPVRVMRLGEPLAEIMPLSRAKNEPREEVAEKIAAHVEGSPQALKRGYIFDGLTARLKRRALPGLDIADL